MESSIYRGTIRHRRFEPIVNEFEYRIFMMYLDLQELPELFKRRWLWSDRRPALARFRRSDHLGPAQVSLEQSVRRLVEWRSGLRLLGPIRLLTHLGYFGYRFNPVSFYYCFDLSGERVEAIVAEINNTPWGEQHCYVLTETTNRNDKAKHYRLKKTFHISPFMDMEMDYDWRFARPGTRLAVHMKNFAGGRRIFDATLQLEKEVITTWSLNRQLVAYPAITTQVIARIYWQAFKLWWKGCPYLPHPHERPSSEEVPIR